MEHHCQLCVWVEWEVIGECVKMCMVGMYADVCVCGVCVCGVCVCVWCVWCVWEKGVKLIF